MINMDIKNALKIFKHTLIILWNSSKSSFILLFIFSMLSGLPAIFNAYLGKQLIDTIVNIIQNRNMVITPLITIGVMYLAVYLIENLIVSITQYVNEIYSSYINKYISIELLEALNSMEMEDVENTKIHNELEKANNESTIRSMNILNQLIQLLKNSTTLLGMITMLLSFNILIVIILIFSTIPLIMLNYKNMNKLYEVYNKRFEKVRFATYIRSLSVETENFKEIKIFNNLRYLKSIILNILNKNIREDKRIKRVLIVKSFIIESIDIIISFVIKGYIIIKGILHYNSVGKITMNIKIVTNIKDSLGNILSIASSMYEDCLYLQGLNNIKQIKNKREQQNKGKIYLGEKDTISRIELINVSFKYPGSNEYVLKDINICFKKGVTYSLVGLNGSGKTTLVKLILGLYAPQEGKILINGIEINEYDKISLFKKMSVVFQDYVKYPLTIRENIGLGDISKVNDINSIVESAKLTGAHKFIHKLPNEYEETLRKGWKDNIDLSEGQWQKIAISRAILRKCEILVLDEPTSSLDPESEYEIFNTIKSFRGNGINILITHRFTNISLADIIIVLEDGLVKEKGTHKELLEENGVYSKLYNIQQEMLLNPQKLVSDQSI